MLKYGFYNLRKPVSEFFQTAMLCHFHCALAFVVIHFGERYHFQVVAIISPKQFVAWRGEVFYDFAHDLAFFQVQLGVVGIKGED